MNRKVFETPISTLQDLNVLLASHIIKLKDKSALSDDSTLKQFTRELLSSSLKASLSLATLENTSYRKIDIVSYFGEGGKKMVAIPDAVDNKEQFIKIASRAVSFINCSFEYDKIKSRNIIWSDKLIRRYFDGDLKKVIDAISLIIAYGTKVLKMSSRELQLSNTIKKEALNESTI